MSARNFFKRKFAIGVDFTEKIRYNNQRCKTQYADVAQWQSISLVMRRSPVRVRSLAPENRRFLIKAAVFLCKKLRSPFGHRFYPVIFPSTTNSTRTAAKICPNFLCFFSQQSGFWHQDIIKHFRRSSLRFFHERDLLIIVVVWSANHFRYNGEFFPCLLYSSLKAILLSPA